MDERLQKVLSRWGIASRRQVEQMLLQERVQVNGEIAHLGQKVNPLFDQISIDGKPIKAEDHPERIYLLMNKPEGVVCTCHDPWARPTVLDLLPRSLRQGYGIHPVGRLDAESTGALLLTNDGDLTFYLTHPRHHIPKTYRVWVAGHPSTHTLKQWQQGIMLDGHPTLPAEIAVIPSQTAPDHAPNSAPNVKHKTLLEIILREGRNRQIRRVAEQLGHPVLQLHRAAIGPIHLQAIDTPELLSGDCRALTDIERSFLNSQIALTSKREPVKNEECHV